MALPENHILVITISFHLPAVSSHVIRAEYTALLKLNQASGKES